MRLLIAPYADEPARPWIITMSEAMLKSNLEILNGLPDSTYEVTVVLGVLWESPLKRSARYFF